MRTQNSSIFENSTAALVMNATEFSLFKDLNELDQAWYYHPLRWVESIVGSAGNTLVIAAVIRFKHLRTPTSCLIVNLALVNLLSACLMPVTTAVESMDRSAKWLYVCIAKIILYAITLYGNILNLMMISIDRLICITKPFWYAKHVKMALVLASVGVMWVATLLTSVLLHVLRSVGTERAPTCLLVYLLSQRDIMTFLLFPYCFFTLVILGNYAVLAMVIWNKGKKIMANNPSASANAIIQAKHRQLTRVMAIVVVCYLCLTAPAAIMTNMVSLHPFLK